MKNGFIYVIVKFILDKLYWLNLVEYFKKVGTRLNPEKSNRDAATTYSRVATDIFIVLKWFFLALIWVFGVTNIVVAVVVWYLIITNLYTYFYHHIWTDESLDTSQFSNDRIRRRFVNLLLAFTYSNASFAYLYRHPYVHHFSWSGIPTSLNSIWFSMSNSVAANYAVVAPVTNDGNSTAMIQLVITFIFLSIIISRSIPQKT